MIDNNVLTRIAVALERIADKFDSMADIASEREPESEPATVGETLNALGLDPRLVGGALLSSFFAEKGSEYAREANKKNAEHTAAGEPHPTQEEEAEAQERAAEEAGETDR